MTFSTIQNSFVAGEISPSLFGRTDLGKYHNAAFTMRNFFANYRGGASSRAGLAYVGTCKQPGTSAPPRDIPFQFNINQGYALEFGDQYMRIKYRGAYVTEATTTISAITQANPGVFTDTAHGYSNGDWIYITGVVGMTNFNGLTWIVANATTNTFTVTDLFGNAVNTTSFSAYVSGGTAARIYTVVSPYAAVDLPYLKYTQSADTMSLTCVNQITLTEYAPYDLVRSGNTSWAFNAVTFASSIGAPSGLSVTAHSSTTLSTWYSYTVTAVSAATGEESVAASPAAVENNDISINAGSNAITWSAVSGAGSYNVYAATPQYGAAVPAGVLYGFIGSSLGTAFTDTNIIADFTQVPPVHTDPFSRGGPNPSTGTYPSVCNYFQQRRVYANTLNQPDTYFMSQPGAFLNFDTSIPVTDGDAITGSPWAQQINGIQALVPMPNGLVILTGKGAWLLDGFNQTALTPSNQSAVAQAYNGCNSIVPPIVINYDILFVQAKGSIVRDLSYNFFNNIYTGTDTTVLSNHLFSFYQILQMAYCEEPFKLLWAVRNDGAMLCLTYLKEQDVYAWTRHDTNGFFVGCCSVIEPPVDALYVITKRYVRGQWMYYSERMDNRNWIHAEDSFCVDAGLAYPLTYPNATLTPAAANGTNNISSVNLISGGSGYTAPTVIALDSTGKGTGATFTANLTSGVITSVTVNTQGSNYTAGYTILQVTDSTGSGAVLQPVITNIISFTASSSVFNSGMVGNVIRIGNNNAGVSTGISTNGGGQATITSYVSGTQVMANVTSPILDTIPNDPNNTPVPAISGEWSVSVPVTTVTNLNHLEGLSVAILADGSVVNNQVVTNGTVTLPTPASSITVGLPYLCQLQTSYLELPGQTTIQGKRKNIYNAVVRVESSRGIQVGSNQVDASTQEFFQNIPWVNMIQIKDTANLVTSGNQYPLFTGDEYINIPAGWATPGQLAVQQQFPLPANILSCTINYQIGDTSDR